MKVVDDFFEVFVVTRVFSSRDVLLRHRSTTPCRDAVAHGGKARVGAAGTP